MTLHRRAPRPLFNALAPLQDAIAPRTLLAEVQAVWSETVGAALAQEAVPVSERAGIVTVRCSGAVWAQELDLMSGDICTRLNPRLRTGQLSGLRCVTSGRSSSR